MEVAARRWWIGVAAVCVAVATLIAFVSWRVAAELPASYSTPAPGSGGGAGATPAASGQQWKATIPPGWAPPADPIGSAVELTDANRNRIVGDTFSQDVQTACAYEVDQELSYQKYTRTDVPDLKVGNRPAVTVRLTSNTKNMEIRCFSGKTAKETWYLKLIYQAPDKAAAEKAFATFTSSFELV